MIKNKKKFSLILILILLLSYFTSFATSEEIEKITNSQAIINKINKQKKEVQNTIKNLKQLKNDTEQFIKELDMSLEQLVTELNLTLEAIDDKQLEINVTNENLMIAKHNEEKQYEDMKKRIVFFYERDNKSILENILEGNNLVDALTRAEYVQSITDYDRNKLNQLIETKTMIAELEERLTKEKDDLVALKDAETAQKESIELLLFEKQKELEDTNNQINKSSKELKKLEADIKAQEDNIRAIEKAIEERERASGQKRVLKGGLIWPLPSSNRITSRFGKRKSPTKGGSTYHQGIDIGASTGEKVIAAASGEVVISTYSYSAGNYIMISHGSQIYTVYMHLSKRSVSEGDTVVLGQKIGEVGSTGYSTGPHLHFGIRKNGEYVDPLTYVG